MIRLRMRPPRIEIKIPLEEVDVIVGERHYIAQSIGPRAVRRAFFVGTVFGGVIVALGVLLGFYVGWP